MDADEVIDEVMGGEEPNYDLPVEVLSTDERRATGMLWHLRRVRAETERSARLFEELIEELELRREAVVQPLIQRAAWLEEWLTMWHASVLERDPKRLTVKLPTGTLSSSKAQDQWDYADPEAFLAWCREHAQGAIRIPPPKPAEIDKTEARRLLVELLADVEGAAIVRETGEKIPGLIIRRGGYRGRRYKQETP